jgi:hypothetical protein
MSPTTLRPLGRGLTALLLASCIQTGPGPEFEPAVAIDMPRADAVDAVVFWIGDAGEVLQGQSPILRRLAIEVEAWSETLARDSAVTVVFLGDNVYPVGVRDRDDPAFPQDSARLWGQIAVVAGEHARRRGTKGIFLAGNHDWGNMIGEQGLARLQNQQEQLRMASEQGIAVELMPEAGSPGPVARDVRENVRLLFIDTHWFLQGPEEEARTLFFEGVLTAMEEAEDRHVILAAHHPYGSAGPHGLLEPGTRALGLLYLMKKSGTLVQDLNSPVYARLLARMQSVFRRAGGAPRIFVGGHDHSLQVLDSGDDEGPETILVSGAGSKVTGLTESNLLRYAAARPGYMMLIFRRNEAVDLYVIAGTAERMVCPADPEEDRVACMTEGAEAFEVVYSERLVPEASLSQPDTAAAPGPRLP